MEESYFLLLELPFDPPENNTEKINDAIAKKRAQWSMEKNKPNNQGKAAQRNLEKLEDIKKVMLDPAARQREADKAKAKRNEMEKNLEDRLELYRAKGDELSPQELKMLSKQYGPFGFTEDEIKRGFAKKTRKQEKIDVSSVLGQSQAGQVERQMTALGIPEKTLYDFLNLSQNSSCSKLCACAKEKTNLYLAKGEKNAKGDSEQALCGLCMTIFKDESSKQKYDNYVNITRYYKCNGFIDEMAMSEQKRISPKVKDALVGKLVETYHIGISDAIDYLKNYCEYKGYALAEDKVVCGLCGAENVPGATSCVKCGKPLVITCPSCGSQNNNSAKVCAKCGFDLTQMEKATELLRQAKQKYAEKALSEAEKLLKEAKAFWPNHADILALEKTIQDERKQVAEIVAAIMKDIQEKRLYSARSKIGQAMARGFSVDSSVASKVTEVIADVEAKLATVRNASGDAAFLAAMKLREVIADCDELNQSLQKFPPEAVEKVTCKHIGDEVTLSWSKCSSVGEVSYQVVRKENMHANGPCDGIVVYTGKELSYTDRNIPKNTAFYYSVFTVRIEVFSRAAKLEETIAVVDKPTKVRAIGGDGMITLSWEKTPALTEVRVYRYRGFNRPENDSAYESIPCARLDGLTINHLDNGVNYWLAICAGYAINGKTFFSEKVYIAAVPQKPAKPLQDFTVQMFGEMCQAKWTQSEWDVILLCAKCQPDYLVDTIYDLTELLQKYEKIELNLKSTTEAEFRIDFVGECYVIPGVINASNVILNHAAYISSVPSVKNVSCDLSAAGTEMYVNFAWPKKVEKALLVYRMDAYPTGPEDPLAHKIEWTKRQYEANEGLVISKPPQGNLFVQVYTYFEGEGKRVYSEGCHALLSNEPQRDVYYTIRYKKPGLFSKKCAISVEVEAEGAFTFPAFTVVSKFKGTPLKRSDGDIVCTMEESTEIKGGHVFEFSVTPLRAGTVLKMFFLNDKDYKKFKIACKSGNTV